MKIAIDCRYANASGIGRYIREVVPRLIRLLEAEYFLIVSKNDLNKDFLARCEGERVRLIFASAGMYSLRAQLELPALVPESDVFWAMHYDVPLLPLRARQRVVTIHDAAHLALREQFGGLKRLYAKLFMQVATHHSVRVFTDSEFSKSELLKYEAVPAERITVHPLGVDREVYRPVTDSEARAAVRKRYGLPKRFFLFVGNVKPHKNLRRLLTAFASFRQQAADEVRLVVAGKKEGFLTGENNLRELLVSLNIEQEVLFTGFVAEADLPCLYTLAEAFVFPSYYEGFGLPPLEALLCGTRVLASQAASMPEVLGDMVQYFDPYDTADMARGLRDILTAPLTESFPDGYSWDRTAEIVRVELLRLGGEQAKK